MSSERSRRDALLGGTAAGAAAYLVGYVLTYLLVRDEARREFGETAPTWKVAGWYHYNAHFVDVVTSRSIGGLGGSGVVNLIAESASSTTGLLYVLPPILLLAAGVAVAWHLDAPDLGSAAVGGAATAIGYGVLAILGAVLYAHTVSGTVFGIEVSAQISIPMGDAVIIVALLYPLVLGTLGAVVGSTVLE